MSDNPRIKKAIEWISAQISLEGEKSLTRLIDEAVFRFDLSPKDSQFIYSFYRDRSNNSGSDNL